MNQLNPKESKNMARKRKQAATQEAEPVAEPVTTEAEVNAPSADVTVTQAAPIADKQESGLPEPREIMTVALTNESGGSKAHLFRSIRLNQMAITFDEKPDSQITAQLRDTGWRWRPEEKAWTIQIDRERRWQTHLEAEEIFTRITDQIRAKNGATANSVA